MASTMEINKIETDSVNSFESADDVLPKIDTTITDDPDISETVIIPTIVPSRPHFKQIGSPTDETRPKFWYSRCGEKNQAYLNIRRKTLKGDIMKVNFKMDRVPEAIARMTFFCNTSHSGDIEDLHLTLKSCLEKVEEEIKKRQDGK